MDETAVQGDLSEEETSLNNEKSNENASTMSVDSTSVESVRPSPNLTKIIGRMSTKVATGVVVMIPGEQDRVYDWLNDDQRDELIEFILDPIPGSSWDTFMSKSPPEAAAKKESKKVATSSNKIIDTAAVTKKSKKVAISLTKKIVKGRGSKGKQNGKDVASIGKVDMLKSKKNDDDDDDDDDSLFGDPGICEEMNQRKMEQDMKPVDLHVSKHMYHTVDGTVSVLVVFGAPGPTFYAKDDHQKYVCSLMHKKMHPGAEIPNWLSTIIGMKIRKEQHGLESKYKRVGKNNNTMEVITFVLTVTKEKEDTIPKTLKHIAEHFFVRSFKKRNKNSAGLLALNHVNLLPVNEGKSGLIGFCLSKGGGNWENTAAVMTEELDKHWKDGINYIWDCTLDKFMTDFDMKEFVKDYLGVQSWGDLNEEMRKCCFRNYPRRELPNWNMIMREAW